MNENRKTTTSSKLASENNQIGIVIWVPSSKKIKNVHRERLSVKNEPWDQSEGRQGKRKIEEEMKKRNYV